MNEPTAKNASQADAEIDLASVLAGQELDLPIAPAQAPAGEMIELAGLWSQMVFSDDGSLDALLGATAVAPSPSTGIAETGAFAVWTFDPLPEPSTDY
ncbi:MAG: hypothetical protein AB7I79_23500 [Rhizobiaceae bacterium]